MKNPVYKQYFATIEMLAGGCQRTSNMAWNIVNFVRNRTGIFSEFVCGPAQSMQVEFPAGGARGLRFLRGAVPYILFLAQ
jgi:hypothetical protein